MKKIVGTIAAMALVASAAFADVGIGAWGRGIWAPVAGNGSNVTTFEAASWGPTDSNIRTGITIHGESENIGFAIDMNADGFKGAGIGDTAFIWAKPWSWLYVAIGKVQDNAARGDGCFGQFGWWRQVGPAWVGTMGYGTSMAGEDLTFVRFGNGAGSQATGAIVKVTPIDGLWIEAAFDINSKDSDENFTTVKEAADVYKNGQYGAGYDIKGIGHIRAQYIGSANAINAAFDLKAVENLTLTVGAKIGLTSGASTTVAAYANYKVAMVTIHALFNGTIATNSFDFEIAAGCDVDLGNGVGVNADVRFYNNGATGDKGAVSFMAGVAKGFSNGVIGVAFEGIILSNTNDFYWSVPVKMEYWF
ncbi:MAG: hypothetical protein MJ169_07875 [Treponema sp.]|nr:hypothetical protein [Treponema sp.]